MAPRRSAVIVHAGFYKTGTTSLQKYLARNRRALKPVFDFYGQDDFKSAGARARTYAQRPFFWRRWRFRRALARFLADIPDAATIVLSCETFSGAMPGHRDWRGRRIRDFDVARPLCRDVAAALRKRFGADVAITFLFTTRAQEPWFASVYGHLLRSIHLTETPEEFRAAFPDMPDLETQAARIAQALHPIPVVTRALEETATCHEGPAAAILDLLDLPADIRSALPPATVENRRQDTGTEVEMMALNRSGMGKKDLKAEKDRMRSGARR